MIIEGLLEEEIFPARKIVYPEGDWEYHWNYLKVMVIGLVSNLMTRRRLNFIAFFCLVVAVLSLRQVVRSRMYEATFFCPRGKESHESF